MSLPLGNRVAYTGAGTTNVFAYTFKIFVDSDITAIAKNTSTGTEYPLTVDTDFTVSGAGNSSGGNVTLIDLGQAWIDSNGYLASGYTLTLLRVRPLTQETDIRNQGAGYRSAIEDAFDHLVMIAQQVQDDIDRSLKLPASETGTITLPTEENRASKFLAFDADGDPIASSGGIDDAIPVSSFVETLLDDTTAAAFMTTLGITSFAQTVLDDSDATTMLATLGLTVSTFAKTILDDASAGDVLTTLGVSTFAKTILDDTTAAAARTTLGAVGTSGDESIAGIKTFTSRILVAQGSGGAVAIGDATNPDLGFYFSTDTILVAVNATLVAFWDANGVAVNSGDCYPNTDNAQNCGITGKRWADVKSVLINGADYGFMNGFYIREYPAKFSDVQTKDEAWFKENANQGLQFINDAGELIMVIGRDGVLYANQYKNLTDLDAVTRAKNISTESDLQYERDRRAVLQGGLGARNKKKSGNKNEADA